MNLKETDQCPRSSHGEEVREAQSGRAVSRMSAPERHPRWCKPSLCVLLVSLTAAPAAARPTVQQPLPKITLAARPDTLIANMEQFAIAVMREGPLDNPVTVTLRFQQDQPWIDFSSRRVTLRAGERLRRVGWASDFVSASVTSSGTITVTTDSVSGYDISDASTTMFVISQEAPPVEIAMAASSYSFQEAEGDAYVVVVARMLPGLPRGVRFPLLLTSEDVASGATASRDYRPIGCRPLQRCSSLWIRAGEFVLEDGSWVARRRVALKILDDEVREGPERLDLVLEPHPYWEEVVQPANPDGASCGMSCRVAVSITDDEDIPALSFETSRGTIFEDSETSSTATVSITNSKSFASDQVLTLTFDGTATEGVDYSVTPADIDDGAMNHQLRLPARDADAGVTLRAVNDSIDEPQETIEITATLDGVTIGGPRTIRIEQEPSGPRVTVGLEGVEPPANPGENATATGMFTTRYVFDEEVEGFTLDDVYFSTAAGSTADGLPIGVTRTNFTEVRAGLEYTVVMTPTKSGLLHVGIEPDAAFSVATGAGNRATFKAIRINLPASRMAMETASHILDEAEEAEILELVGSVSAEAAAAALLGGEGLSEIQLSALDRLGNNNGGYDLGDLLSWMERCRRDEASCGRSPSVPDAPSSAALASGATGRGGSSSRRRRGGSGERRRSPVRRVPRRRRRTGYAFAILLATSMTWACADGFVRPQTADFESDPGLLTIQMTVPSSHRDIGAMLVVKGPAIDSVTAPGFRLIQRQGASSIRREVIVIGSLADGADLHVWASRPGHHGDYRVRVLQVAGEDYTLQDPADYRTVIRR